jgi:hypothetical protein
MDYIFENWKLSDYIFLCKAILIFYILFGVTVLKLLKSQSKRFLINDNFLLISFVVLITVIVGTRGSNIGTDTSVYYSSFFLPAIESGSLKEALTVLETDILFAVLVWLTSLTENFSFFLFVVSLILNSTLYVFVRKFTDYGKKGSSLLLFLMIFSAFSIFSLEFNIIRNALSIVYLLLAIYYILSSNYKYGIVFMIISILSHRSALLPVVLIIIVLLTQKFPLKYFVGLYLLAIGFSAIGYGFHSIGFLADSSIEDFRNFRTKMDIAYRVGFRLDFVVYNSFFLFLFLKFSNLKNKTDIFLIRLYILSSLVFFLYFHIIFSDRVGLYSWILTPLLLYNIINERYPSKKLHISSIVLLFYYTINHVVLFN